MAAAGGGAAVRIEATGPPETATIVGGVGVVLQVVAADGRGIGVEEVATMVVD